MPKNIACPGMPWVSDPITDQEMAFAISPALPTPSSRNR